MVMIKKEKFIPKKWRRCSWEVYYSDICNCKGCYAKKDIYDDVLSWAFNYAKDGYIANNRIKFPLSQKKIEEYKKRFPYMILSPYKRGWRLEQIFLDFNDAGFFLKITELERNRLDTYLKREGWLLKYHIDQPGLTNRKIRVQ